MTATFSKLRESDARPFADLPEGSFQLPVLLEEIPAQVESAFNDYQSVGKGELTQPGSGPKLETVTMTTQTILGAHSPGGWMPTWYSAQPGAQVPGHQSLLDRLRLLQSTRTPFGLVIFDVLAGFPFVAMKVTLRSVGRGAKGGEADTWHWTLQCKEWRKVAIGRKAHRRSSRKSGSEFPTKHTLTAADTLASLAREYYGIAPASICSAIAQANGIKRWGNNDALANTSTHKGFDGWKVGRLVTIPGGVGGAVVGMSAKP
ncbi:MAG: hypothetical protein KGL39_38625 [Patescibacteria group bacterium]|nr:hypothetical protein [Patescibacteria group bacterium]